MLRTTDTNNSEDSTGEFLGINGQWFLLPLGGIGFGGIVGIFKQDAFIRISFGIILGTILFFVARFLSQQHAGWSKFLFRKLKRLLLREPYVILNARGPHSRKLADFWRSKHGRSG